MVINSIVAVLNYQISMSKVGHGKQNLSSIELSCMNIYVGSLGLSVVKNLFRTLQDWSWNM
jgi:hypothetical protein